MIGLREANRIRGYRIGPLSKQERPLGEGLLGKIWKRCKYPALRLIQLESVERGGIGIQNQDADVGFGRLMQDFHQ